MKNLFFFLFLTLFAVGCSRPDPKPELKDAIYNDLQSELKIVESSIAETTKQLAEYQTALEAVVPQTGQIRYAQKRVNETAKALALFEQHKKYWLIRLTSRRDYVRLQSLKAFNKNETWVDAEVDQYFTEKRLRRARLEWNARQRREDFLQAEFGKTRAPASTDALAAGSDAKAAPKSGGH